MQRIGWFDAFRENGDPTWFGENRTPVVFDLQIFALASIFLTPFLAFLIILPGVRHYRIASTIAFVLSITVGAIILSMYEFNFLFKEIFYSIIVISP
uniref:7TMR-DISM_7TM domain-containing protein n=1 Tax=Elaeophora elaphi TaxID=1147741 RepID=A0A0R3S504_9BILA